MPSRYSVPVPQETTGSTSLRDSSTKPIHAIFMPPKSTALLQISGNSSPSLAQRTMASLHWLSAA